MSPFTGYTRGWAVKSITNNQSQRGWHGEEREDTDEVPPLSGSAVIHARTRTRTRRQSISLSVRETPCHAGARAWQPSTSAPQPPLSIRRSSLIDTHFVEDELQGAVETHGCPLR